MKQLSQTGPRRQRGAALVEFAIVMPMVLLLLFGTIEFGFAMYRLQGLHSASREAARAGAYPTTSHDAIEERALASLEGTMLAHDPLITIMPDVEYPCESADEVVVTITAANPLKIPFWGNADVTLNSRAEYSCEN